MFFKSFFSRKKMARTDIAAATDMKGCSNEEKITARCGHEIKSQKGEVTAFGETIKTIVLVNEENVTEYCHACLSRMAILCAWCGKPIFIGDPVTLYIPKDSGYRLREGSKIYCENPLQLVGCLRWECAESGADRAGFWYPPGEVYRVLT
jgi:hypothetical protein